MYINFQDGALIMNFEKLITEIGFTEEEKKEILSFNADENTRAARDFAMFNIMKKDFPAIIEKTKKAYLLSALRL